MAEWAITTPKAYGVFFFTDKKPLKRLAFAPASVTPS